jgi:hypothetical protein
MPNWVHNHVEVTGPAGEIDRFKRECIRECEGERSFDFESLTPMPDIIKKTEAGSDPLDWSCAHWGTKRNACHFHESDGPGGYGFYFDTACEHPCLTRRLEHRSRTRSSGTKDDAGAWRRIGPRPGTPCNRRSSGPIANSAGVDLDSVRSARPSTWPRVCLEIRSSPGPKKICSRSLPRSPSGRERACERLFSNCRRPGGARPCGRR